MLDAECFAFLARALESPLAPTVVLATNRGVCAVREGGGGGSGGSGGGSGNSSDPFYSETLAPHGVPVDLLDRAVIVRAAPLSPAEAAQVIALRAGVEGVTLDEAALAALAAAAAGASLRHAVGLLAPAAVLAAAAGRKESGVTAADVAAARELFWDAKASARKLAQAGGGFVQ